MMIAPICSTERFVRLAPVGMRYPRNEVLICTSVMYGARVLTSDTSKPLLDLCSLWGLWNMSGFPEELPRILLFRVSSTLLMQSGSHAVHFLGDINRSHPGYARFPGQKQRR